MSNIVPEKGTNFKVYLNGTDLLGIAEGNFPSGDFMTSEVKGAGLAGVIDSPVLGHMNSITVTLNWRTTTPSFMRLAAPVAHTLDMYASHAGFDAGRGIYSSHGVHVFMKAVTKKWDLGKLVVGETTSTESEHEVYYMKVFMNDSEVFEVDKYNYIFKVYNTDYLYQTRRELGML